MNGFEWVWDIIKISCFRDLGLSFMFLLIDCRFGWVIFVIFLLFICYRVNDLFYFLVKGINKYFRGFLNVNLI